jgi:hypothetical protein
MLREPGSLTSWLSVAAVLVGHHQFLMLPPVARAVAVICKSLMLTSPLERLP